LNILELNKNDPVRQAVFVLIGSMPSGLKDMEEAISKRVKGQDLLDRVPVLKRFEIPVMTIGDRVIVVATQIGVAAREQGYKIASLEKFAVYFALTDKRFSTPRQIRELVNSAVSRMPRNESLLRYDDLFGRNEPLRFNFWTGNIIAADELTNTYVRLSGASA
jgi:hypothetical protein